MSDLEPLTYDSDRLIREWRDRYTSRRTIAAQMLDEAEVLVRDAVIQEREHEREHSKTERERDLERREWDLERREKRAEHTEDRLRRELAEAKAEIESLSARTTLMRESRETVEDGTVVRLLAPTVPSYGDSTSVRPWMLGELEDVTHRLRMAGAEESTEVRFKRDAIEACVPFAEFALVSNQPLEPPRHPEAQAPRRLGLPVAPALVMVGAAMALVFGVGLLVAVLS